MGEGGGGEGGGLGRGGGGEGSGGDGDGDGGGGNGEGGGGGAMGGKTNLGALVVTMSGPLTQSPLAFRLHRRMALGTDAARMKKPLQPRPDAMIAGSCSAPPAPVVLAEVVASSW